jgi:pyruvate,water dikinase
MSRQDLRALEGKWVELTVGANEWKIREATLEEANAFWEATKPAPVTLPALDLEVRDLRDIKAVTVEAGSTLKDAIQKATLAFGAKSANYSVLSNTADVPIRKAFAIPVYYYVQFMEENGFYKEVDALLADPTFQNSPKVRDQKLAELRERIEHAPVNMAFQELLRQKLAADYPNLTMRFRTSTNAEDLAGFPCAGCYESHTGDPKDWEGDLLDAVRKTWAGVWFFRTFEERAYHAIDHKKVGMALLVHHNFPAEEANGVALTANPFDPSGLEPGFYVNVQWGGQYEVVHPPPGSTSDEFLYFFDSPNQPTTYLSHSNLVDEGEHVLSRAQIYELGKALKAIHERYSPAYGPKAGNQGWFAMDVEFKYDDEDSPGEPAKLVVKQARPHPGRGQ